ncbi:MAG: RNA-binding transcriptional accessory protein [Candidatus Jettenia sp.]|uniref:S1 motif domain-containing protein n=1 Tax=Candidatus Jettenia caeni TaxID=247490 RepID=I3IMN4_9BACT|nr:Tex family protein [Candidatus Jettenia sp. AMX1]MBC6928761.1 RNA-binding transcriptional accessory protein [Candidatus Jettenia sp.]NUN24351.1 RNA-binding transcriptional accessory protein [Candidatus Jettenia caeni]KAA0250733.1 MAG: RNA-binding transcriptional accessory protein [Candidatus Jettenia sp. AMX1]MCE7880073.1 RNA-binding transcriptional accessory protein [Candidatus Jettenia sp. AMX1]MCQ3926854.1 RNA-binding transcriptional accessory protein [Candidatus Jettenia sp.]
MNEAHIIKIASELHLAPKQVRGTALLLDEGATVPFIARYRKEATGSLDEVAITTIRDRLIQLADLDKRRDAIVKALEERGQLTDELKEKLIAAESLAVLEDIYLPYRPKRRTRATIAREKGLEPLAKLIFDQDARDPATEATAFVNSEKGVDSGEDALAGARDIIAEWINEDQTARTKMRDLYTNSGIFKTKVIPGKEEEGIKYKDYFDWEEPVSEAPSHRILAMRRGEKEGFLILHVNPPEDKALSLLEALFVKGDGLASQQVRMAIHDSYKRLLSLSMETEIRIATKEQAEVEAIKVFAENVRQLLLASPLGQKNVLAVDPGFRTGCKVVCLNRQGKLVHTDTIYPHQSEKATAEAASTIIRLCEQFAIEAIAVGNGTAGRETESFVRKLKLPGKILVVMVNESGASVYSASETAREEFPDYDVTVRGSVSIGRRLMDPLAELVKIDPKSIGVGQYQHDVDQGALKKSLDDVVISCVNKVGVEVNTASKQLLTYVSGLGPQLAGNIVKYRNEHGPFTSREELKKVPRLGPNAFEQSAGFLRIRDGGNPLDGSAVHPESYPIVYDMAKDLGCSVTDLMRSEELRKKINLTKYVTGKVGLPTLNDILAELSKPGRDPREKFEAFGFAEGIEKMEDVKPGMRLPGIVTNITAFGAFVDIGVHQDGLVHISELADTFVKNPNDFVRVHQTVTVTVLDVDIKRKRISLSMRNKQKQVNT